MSFQGTGNEVLASCPFHADGKRPNFSVKQSTNQWFCHVCDEGGGLIKFVQKKEGLDFAGVCRTLGINGQKKKKPEVDVSKLIPTATYDYCNATGDLVYQVCRYQTPDPEEPGSYAKTFRQRRPGPNGSWVWNTEGVQLVPFHLPEILAQSTEIVHIVEGEKDAVTLQMLGFLSTTNVRGAGKWLAAYSEYLTDREVAIWPDNDEPGRRHAQDVLEKVSKKARSVRMMQVPDPFKDITEWADSILEDTACAAEIQRMLAAATPLYEGVDVPVFSIAELENNYRTQAQASHTSILNLSDWLPSFNREVRGIVPGEVGAFLAATGVGKTCLLQNLAIHAAPLTTLLFELELPGELTFERFVASANQTECAEVFNTYAAGEDFNWRNGRSLGHVYVCPRSSLTCDQIERIIDKSELKIGSRPTLVLLDYVQLVNGMGKSRYERVSGVAERIKTIAKNTNTIIFIASQIARPEDPENPEVTIYDAKDSGSIENSAGLLIGAWREPGNHRQLNLKVLKNTKGRPGLVVRCNFFGEMMRITEQGAVDEADVPHHHHPTAAAPETEPEPTPELFSPNGHSEPDDDDGPEQYGPDAAQPHEANSN